jgi:hypothetical protein
MAGARGCALGAGARGEREECGAAAGGRDLQGAVAGARPAGAAAPEVVGKGRRPAGEELAAGSRNLRT